jgi:hypothetical protein
MCPRTRRSCWDFSWVSRLWVRAGRKVDWNDTKSCFDQLPLSFHNRLHKRRIASECRNDAVPHVGKVVRIKWQSGNSADVDVKGCRLTKRRSLGCIDQKMLTGSAPAFKCDPGSRVDDDREPLVPDPTGGQAEHDVRRRPRSGCFPEGEIAADVMSGLHPLREELAEVG